MQTFKDTFLKALIFLIDLYPLVAKSLPVTGLLVLGLGFLVQNTYLLTIGSAILAYVVWGFVYETRKNELAAKSAEAQSTPQTPESGPLP